MFKRKIDEIFKELPNVFGIVYAFYLQGISMTVETMATHYKEITNIHKGESIHWIKIHVIMGVHHIPLFGEIVSRQGRKPDLRKLKIITHIPPLKLNVELKTFLCIPNYLSKFSPSDTEVCKPLRWITYVNTEWTME